ARIVGMGIGVAGIVRRSDGTVMFAPNLGWRDVPFGALLDDALGSRFDMLLANEADLAVLAEVRRGAAKGVDDVLCIWGEVGVGGAPPVASRCRAGRASRVRGGTCR